MQRIHEINDFKKLKNTLKKYKKKEMNESKIVINNHVDTKHFEYNFSGIKDMFVGMFGS